MTVDNSNLTGEGDPQRRNVEAHDPAVLEAENLAFMGTTVVNGKGFGIVIRRGNATVIGKISTLAGASKEDMTSPLTEEIRSFVFITGAIAFILAIVLFAVGLAVDVSFVNALTIAIGIFVAFALTGMPMTITMLLSYASRELSKHNVLVKNLHGMDTLGAITLLASDKTGTLTMNVMQCCDSAIVCCMHTYLYSAMRFCPPSVSYTMLNLPTHIAIPKTVVELWRYGLARQDTSSADGTSHAIDSSLTRTSSGIDTNILDDDLLMCISLCNSHIILLLPLSCWSYTTVVLVSATRSRDVWSQ
eukprot:3315-Heterococcus_DN1.PRE.2